MVLEHLEGRGGARVLENIHSVGGAVHRLSVLEQVPHPAGNWIDRQQFEEGVQTLNNLYAEAGKFEGQSSLETCLAPATPSTIFLRTETPYEKVLKIVSKYIKSRTRS